MKFPSKKSNLSGAPDNTGFVSQRVPVLTAAVYEDLKNASSYDRFEEENRDNMITQNLSQYLQMLLEQKHLRIADVVRGSHLDKAYVYQIFDGKKMPSRDKLIAVAFGLRLDELETQRMLKVAGYSDLYVKIPRDALILYSIMHGRDILQTDDALYASGFATLLPEK